MGVGTEGGEATCWKMKRTGCCTCLSAALHRTYIKSSSEGRWYTVKKTQGKGKREKKRNSIRWIILAYMEVRVQHQKHNGPTGAGRDQCPFLDLCHHGYCIHHRGMNPGIPVHPHAQDYTLCRTAWNVNASEYGFYVAVQPVTEQKIFIYLFVLFQIIRLPL